MKKFYKPLFICLLILSGSMVLKAQNVDDTFSIESKEDLITFADLVENNKSLNARLYADIDLEGGYWNTICETALYYNSYSNDYGYSGTFDGNGHVIKNFKVKSSTTADASASLFGTVCGTIKNLGVENFTFEDGGKDIRAAAIVGQLITTGGKISNCYVKNATITPGEHVTGGIAGCVYDGTIENCYVVNSNINGSSGRYGYIVGDSRGDKSSTDRPGTVTNCYSDNTPLISDRKGNLSSVENKSAAQFASGEIAYLLQGNQQTDIWGQNIDNGETKETLPVLGGAKVYKIYNSGCTHYGEFIYSNDANAEFYHEHSFTEDSNGFCTLCNGYEAAELVDGVYHIGNLGQLMWFANNVNTAHKVLLTADITIDNSVVWKPIGLQDGASNSSIFNGDGHTITFDNTNEGSVFGLFGTYNYSIIENLYLAGSITCNTTDNVGALVNSAYRTTIRNVISYVEVTNIGSGRAGGLAGQFGGQHSGELYSLIENCAVYADVTGNVAGGIIGHGWSGNQYYDIKNVAYAGDVTGSERQAAVIAYHGNNSSTTKCKFENIYYCEKDALGFVGGGGNNYDLGTDVAAKTTAQFASGEVAYLLQGEQETQVWGQNIDNGETVQQYPVFSDAKVHLISCGDVNIYSNTYVEHSFNENGFCNTCGNCEPAVFEDNYYLISNAGNLVWFSKHVNNDNFSANAKLMNDIEMNAVQWTPIGTSDAYNGTFDGQGHTINNLWHNTGVADGGREGLFTLIGSDGVVTGVTLNNATIWGSSPYGLNGTGGIAVRNEGCITNTIVTNSSIQQGAYEYLGGIAGWNKGSITNCAVINSTLTRRWGGANSGTMGGITQTNNGSVTNCYTYGCMFNNGNNLNSAIVAKENAAVNSYYYTTDNVADAAETARTKEQFASGEVAYLLQGEQTTQIWGQNIDNGETVQTYPVISDAKVYKHTFNGVTLYSNHKTLKAGGKCGDNLYWYVDKNNTLTIYGTGAMWDNKSPWRNLNPKPTSLVLKEGITHIGEGAFYVCSGFTGSLTIPNSVKTIGNYAFQECSGFTGDLTIPNSVTAIGKYAFYNCTKFNGSLTIGNSVTAIGNDAFRNCSGFTGDLTIPNSVTAIEGFAFYGCSGFNGSLTIPNSITTIGNSAFSSCSGFNGSLTIPNSVTTIGNYTFKNCYGFNGYLTIGNSVTAIGDYAFSGCSSFTDVYSLAETAPTLGTEAFPMFKDINPNTTLYYPTSGEQSYNAKGWFNYFSKSIGLDKCGDNLYWNVDDTNTLTIFGTGAMYDYEYSGDNISPWKNLGTAPTSLVLEEGITTIGNFAFYNCSSFTGSLTIPNSITSIGDYAFQNCSGFTGSLTIPNSVTAIGDYAFSSCSGFTGSLTIPNSVTAIGDYAFTYCKGFNGSLTIPNSVTSIGEYAFYYCFGFNGSLTIPNSVTAIGNSAFELCSGFTGSLTIPNSVTTIGDRAFYYCKSFNGSLTIPNSVTAIGEYAFYYCFGFNGSLTIPNSVTSIGNYAFYYCKGFTGSLTIPNSVTTIGDYAFQFCDGFTGSLTISNSVTTIGNYAFYGCSSFNGSLTIGDSVTTIGNYAFYNCSSFNGSLTIPNSVTTIGDYAFDDCLGFTGSLTIPNSVTSIGDGAFAFCRGFTGSLTIGNSVTTIGEYAFYGCSSFTDVYSSAVTAPTLGTDAFDKPNNATLYYPGSSKQSYNDNGWFEYFPQHIGFNGKCGDNLYWYVDDDNTLTIFGTGAMYDYNYYYGSNISPWKNLGTAPTSLMLEEGVTHIGNYAFYQCRGFKGSLTIPNSVTSIGNSAFDNCISFTGSLTIPNSITSIGNNAFRNCSGFNGSLTIGNSVTAIGNYAFYYCYGFTGSLTIPNSVTSIGESAFCSCSGFTEIFLYRDTNPTIGISAFSGINAKVCAPVIWKSFSNIPSGKLVKMATFVGEQSAVSGQQSGWVFPEGMTEVSADDHVAINAPMVISGQQSAVSGQQSANSLSVKSFGLCGNENTTNGRISIEDGGQLYCEVARGEVTVKKEILGYQQSGSESESKWYTIASPLKDAIQITPNSTLLTPNSDYDLYRYDEPSHTWQNAKNSANNGFNTIEPGRGYLYANAKNTTLEFKGDIYTENVTYNLTAKSDVLKGFHLVGNPFTHDIYLGEAITESQRIIFEFNDEYGDGWNGNALKLSFSNGTPDKIITMESGNSETETISVATGVTVRVSFMKDYSQEECSFTIKYDDGEIICDKYSNDGSLTSVVDGETLTEFTVKEGKDILVNGYYTLTGEGAWAAEASTTKAIKPMQSILVKSLVDDYELKIYNTSRQPSAVSRQRSGKGQQTTDNGQQSLCISVSNAKYSDRAFVVFDKGVGLDKMNHENENIPLLYIPMEDADYAIAMMDINVNEIPVNFETNVMGEYTISLRQENCEFDELYLLDKETDEKVNILEQDYTFIATSSENPERFILMKYNRQQTTDNRPWVYVNNGDIVIYNIEGDADIKIFDALGRCVYQGESSDETTRIANGYSSGVYMIQKADDKGVNVQKIIL